MYAIVDIASQQFKVEAGMDIFVNRLPAHNGESVEFDKVLLIDEAGAVLPSTMSSSPPGASTCPT